MDRMTNKWSALLREAVQIIKISYKQEFLKEIQITESLVLAGS